MRLLVQRVSQAAVEVHGQVIGAINHGLLVLVGFHRADTLDKLPKAAHKLLHLRIFADDAGKMNRSVREVGGALLIVSQFTLYGRLEKGFRPCFTEAASGAEAQKLYSAFLEELKNQAVDVPIATGEFGAMMKVSLTNDGPVTLMLEF
ncbi:MAG: D-aminoacyl-tRNA deacylase [Bacteroidia bacterium]|nr:D-aminoacyl-tRNA deacylase [Bacteroidia bacterium]MCX7651800.1 D-aminoacyl-tRNA deacylase [Bacteroidia bacterium]MDW8417098.1 D-aminoacyl-tRNA deacylase [Bacteroidia bacterium]